MEHEVIPAGEIHAPHNWVVADEAARLALVVTEADLGKYCWQRDNENQWFLIAHDPVQWAPMQKTVAWVDVSGKPDLIEEGDSRLTDSRTPTGGAGGVLSGSFPNPGFAVDMATQGEVDTQVALLYTALDDLDAAKIDATEKGAANGVATLGADQKIPAEQLPAIAITGVFPVANEAAMLALTAERGDMAIRSDLNKSFALAAEPASTLANWLELKTPTDAVLSVAGRTGAIMLAKSDVGLANVDNTSDASKPVSTAQAAAIAAHTEQSTGAHAASAISNTPSGGVAATNVQGAINELDSEKFSKSGGDIGGNVNFTGSGRRITGAFGGVPVANRTLFQTSIANDSTTVGIIPNGTATNAYLQFSNSSDPDNSAYGYMGFSSNALVLISTALGSGTKLPIDIDGKLRIGLDGSVLAYGGGALGYGVGAGGTVVQATSKSTNVTLNKPSGRITTHNSALAAGETVTFLCLNSYVSANTCVLVNGIYAGGASYPANYQIDATQIAAGYFTVRIKNISAGSLSDALTIQFNVHPGATS